MRRHMSGRRLMAVWAVGVLLAGAGRGETGMALQPGARLAIVGDSITEQKQYSNFIETYLRVCRPDLNASVIQLGWSGETAAGFCKRMETDIVPWKPTVVTLCYGMNDGGYRAYAEATGKGYEDNMRKIVDRMKAAGATVVVGSPGVVDTATYHRGAPGDADVYNDTLAKLGEIDRKLAAENGFPFADVHGAMMSAMTNAKAAYGAPYHVAGGDGVHPAANGHLVMAYAFLKAMGMDGNVGKVTVDWPAKAQASEGHSVVSFDKGVVTLESRRYAFCFAGGEKDPGGTISILPHVPFQQDLNRFVLVVNALPTDQAEVKWGAQSKTFTREQLKAGINLAAEFLDNPFGEPFRSVSAAVGRKQEQETRMIKVLFPTLRDFAGGIPQDAELQKAIDVLRGRAFDRAARSQEEVKAAVKPVKHEIAITPLGKGGEGAAP